MARRKNKRGDAPVEAQEADGAAGLSSVVVDRSDVAEPATIAGVAAVVAEAEEGQGLSYERGAAGAEEGATEGEVEVSGAPIAAVDGEIIAPEAAGDDDEGAALAAGEALPDERVLSIVESLLFAADRPLGLADLKRLLGMRETKRIEAALEALGDRMLTSGVQLVTAAGGYRLRTNPDNGEWVGRLLVGKPVRLSRAMLETLAIIAYRQPITRPEIDDIRGVDCGPVLKTLLDRNLIRIIGKKEEVGRPLLYATTPEFLRIFNLKDLTELPTLREFHELNAENQAKIEAKHGRGEAPVDPAAAVLPTLPGDGAPVGPVQPHAGLSQAGPVEDESLLEELEQATQAAARAIGAHEPEPGSGPPAGG